MKCPYFVVLAVTLVGVSASISEIRADNAALESKTSDIEIKFRGMVDKVKGALEGSNPDLAKVGDIIQEYCNMYSICAFVSRSYIQKETKGMNPDDRKKFIEEYITGFKPVYTAYLARTWASETNAKTFKDYDLIDCKVVGTNRVELTFKNKADGKESCIMLGLDSKNLIQSIQFGERSNLIDPISADGGSCVAGVSKGKEPKDIFAPRS